jgi:hypothetical protein
VGRDFRSECQCIWKRGATHQSVTESSVKDIPRTQGINGGDNRRREFPVPMMSSPNDGIGSARDRYCLGAAVEEILDYIGCGGSSGRPKILGADCNPGMGKEFVRSILPTAPIEHDRDGERLRDCGCLDSAADLVSVNE